MGSRKGFLVDDRTDIHFLSQFDVAALFDHGNGFGEIEQSFGGERCDDVGLCVFGGSHKDISFADAFVVEKAQIAGITSIHLIFGVGDGTVYGFLFFRISLHDPRADVVGKCIDTMDGDVAAAHIHHAFGFGNVLFIENMAHELDVFGARHDKHQVA